MSGFSESQSVLARQVRQLMKDAGVGDPRLVCRSKLADATRASYPQLMHAPSKVVASYLCAALRSPHFLWAVGCSPMSKEVQMRHAGERLRSLQVQLARALKALDDALGKS